MVVTGIGSESAFPQRVGEIEVGGLTKQELVAAMIWAVAVGGPDVELAQKSEDETRQAARVAIIAADILLEELERC